MIEVIRQRNTTTTGTAERVDTYPNADRYRVLDSGYLHVVEHDNTMATYAPGCWTCVNISE
jgi:hypothetical protein